MNPDGMIMMTSKLTAELAIDSLEVVIRARGMTVFAKIDHAANARAVDLVLRPTTLLIFGDARAGTALMLAAQTIAIDLPHRGLVWCDASGQTWLAYDDPGWLAHRHRTAVDARIVGVAHTLANLFQQAAVGTSH
jgi:uncharacterized protein (DUF302 family)